MSAYYLITFCGHPLRRVADGVMEVCADSEATTYTSETEAWLAAYRQGLKPEWTRVRQPITPALSHLLGEGVREEAA